MKKLIRPLCLLAACVLLLASFGYTARCALAYREAEQIAQERRQSAYTLATMNVYSFVSHAQELDPTATEFVVPSENKIMGMVNEFASVAVPVQSMTFAGIAEGVQPISTGHDHPRDYDPALEADWNWMVLTVTCLTSISREGFPEGCWMANVHVDQVNASPDFYTVPETIMVYGQEGGYYYDQPMLEPGVQYVLCGRYTDNVLYRYHGAAQTFATPAAYGVHAASPSLELEGWAWYYDWMQFVSDPADTEWTARAVEIAETNNARLPVYCVNDLRRVELCADGRARMVEGRAFTQEEMAHAAPVCIISADLAQRNGLCVGDRVEIDLYGASYGTSEGENPQHFYVETGYIDAQDDHQRVSLEIIGLYDAPAYVARPESFSLNTVFAPYGIAQAPNPRPYNMPLCLLNPILLDRQQSAFEAELTATELPQELYDIRVIGSIPMKEEAIAEAESARAALIAAVSMTGVLLLVTAAQVMALPRRKVKACLFG